MSYLADTSIKNRAVGRLPQLASLHWGLVPGDADEIFSYCIEDKERFNAVMPKAHVAELASRKKLLHVTNPFFGYNVIVPQGYTITESLTPDGVFISGIGTPGQREVVRITAVKVPMPQTKEQAVNQLRQYAASFTANVLGIRITPPPLPEDPRVFELGPLSEANPWYSQETGAIRQWQRYANHPRFNESRLVLYAIDGDNFLTVDIMYPTDILNQRILPETFVEHMFIAHSLSFIKG